MPFSFILISMINCPLCDNILKSEEGQLIWRGDSCRVILVNDSDLPGFCRVIWSRHLAEMTDLTYGEREHVMALVFAVEEAVRHVMHPDKVNIASLGNMVPHIHWHIIPRFRDDAFFPGTAWSVKTQITSPETLNSRQQLAQQLPDRIRSAIANLS